MVMSEKISQTLLDGIDERIMKIKDSPEYFSERAELIEKGLRHLGDLHSFWLEHPELRKKLLMINEVKNEKEIKDVAKKGIKNIKRAWKYLASEQLKESEIGVLGYMAPEIIEKVGKFVDPKKNHAGFRKGLEYVDSPFSNYTPKNPELILPGVKKLCDYIHTNDNLHPVELAGEVHMRLAGLQAFHEGNKRTSRLLERRILEGYGLPTSVIPFGEREHYLGILTTALDGLKEKDVEMQKPFFNYIGGKVATALDTIIDDLKIGEPALDYGSFRKERA